MKNVALLFLMMITAILSAAKGVDIDSIISRYHQSKTPKAQVKTLISEKKYSSAYKKIAEYLKKNPDGEGYLLLGFILEKLSMPDKAVIAYQEAISRSPELPEPYNNLSSLMLASGGNPQTALELSSKALKIIPDRPEFLDTYAYALYKNGRHPEALKILQNLLPKTPDSPSVYYHLGLTLLQFGSREESLKAFKNALLLQPDFPEVIKEIEELEKKPAADQIKVTNIYQVSQKAEVTSETGLLKPEKPPERTEPDVKADFSDEIFWREDSFKSEYESGFSAFQKQDSEKAFKVWRMSIFWFMENSEISPYIVKSVRYLALLSEQKHQMDDYREYFLTAQLMDACLSALKIRRAEKEKDFHRALKLLKESNDLPGGIRPLADYKEKIFNLYNYARLKGEEISLVSRSGFAELITPGFRDPGKSEVPDKVETFMRYCRSGDYQKALSSGQEIRQFLMNDPAFVYDLSLLLALHNRTDEAWRLLNSRNGRFFEQMIPEMLLLKAQILLY